MFNQHWAPSNLKIPDPLISSVQSEAYLVTCRLRRKCWLLSSYLQELLVAMGKVGGSVLKNLPANAGDSNSNLGQEDPWRRKWQLTPVFLPGISHGQMNLVSYSPWVCKRIRQDLVTKQITMEKVNVDNYGDKPIKEPVHL